MPDLVRAYIALIKASWALAFTYRTQIVLQIVGFVFPFVMLAIWLTIEQQTGPIGGFDRTSFISYYVATAAVFRIADASALNRWNREISSGELSVRLLKPLDPFHHFFSDILGFKILDVIIILPIVIAAVVLIPGIAYPLTPARVLAFLCSMVIALTVSMLFGTVFGMLSFWSTQSHHVGGFWNGIGHVLSGFIVPLALLPPGLREIAYFLPFRSMVSLPVEILMGRLSWVATGLSLLLSLMWAVAGTVLYRLLWRRGLRRYEAVGS